jgi:hypothetical protein
MKTRASAKTYHPGVITAIGVEDGTDDAREFMDASKADALRGHLPALRSDAVIIPLVVIMPQSPDPERT